MEAWQPIDLQSDPDDFTFAGDPGQLIDAITLIDDLRSRRPAWMTEAALCRDRPEVSWFPDDGETAEAAVDVCAACSVRAECSSYAAGLGASLSGVWAGSVVDPRPSEDERRTVALRAGPPLCVDCGASCKKTRCLACHNAWALALMTPGEVNAPDAA